ncbi:MAG: hypothetical protein ACXWQQ_07935 [Pseudobdellovibrio sp.]
MKKSSWIGFSILGAIGYYGVFMNMKVPMIYLDQQDILIVVGCTVAAALISYPYASLTRIIDYFIWGLIFKKKNKHLKISQDIAGARSSFLINQTYLTTEESHPFLRESVMFLLNRNISNKAFEEILKSRSDIFKKKYHEDATILKSLGKYPIIFGLVTFLLKSIEILATMNTVKHTNVPLEFATAAIAVVWGLLMTGIIIYPLADSAVKAADEDQIFRNLIVDGMILIRQKATDDHFQAYMRGYLNINDRSEFKIFTANTQYPFAVAPRIEHKDEIVENDLAIPQYSEPVKLREQREVVNEPQPAPVAAVEVEQETPVQEAVVREIRRPSFEEIQARMVVGSEGQAMAQSKASAPKVEEETRTKTKTELPGRVEEPVKIDANASMDLGQFKFKDLRNELKSQAKNKRKIS